MKVLEVLQRRSSATPFRPGVYRHYKGGLYYAMLLATDTERKCQMVVYKSMATGEVWTRPLYGLEGAWLDELLIESGPDTLPEIIPRFEFLRDEYAHPLNVSSEGTA